MSKTTNEPRLMPDVELFRRAREAAGMGQRELAEAVATATGEDRERVRARLVKFETSPRHRTIGQAEYDAAVGALERRLREQPEGGGAELAAQLVSDRVAAPLRASYVYALGMYDRHALKYERELADAEAAASRAREGLERTRRARERDVGALRELERTLAVAD